MRILFVTPMWPGPQDPDFGSFLVPIVDELERLGHEVDVVAITRRAGGPRRHLRLAIDPVRALTEDATAPESPRPDPGPPKAPAPEPAPPPVTSAPNRKMPKRAQREP